MFKPQSRLLLFLLLYALVPADHLFAQNSPTSAPSSESAVTNQAPQSPAENATPNQESQPAKITTLPAGTRLPLVIENGISTRTAKPGDSVYFQTTFPIAQDNRIAIPAGTFAHAEVIEAKRAGRLKGRAELRMRINSLTFANGYVVSFVAVPGSLDMRTPEGMEDGGTIKGASGVGKDAAIIGTATAGGLLLGGYGGTVGAVATNSVRAFSTGIIAGGGAGLVAGILYVALTRGPDVELRPGTTMDAVLDRPLALEIAHLPANDAQATPFVHAPSTPIDGARSYRRPRRPQMWGIPLP